MSRLVVNTIETTATNPLSIVVDGAERASVDSAGVFKMNSGYGSVAPVYGCRAWVHFNGTGTVAIVASGNVSSITDNGNGRYTVNFTTAMPDANYTVSISGRKNDTNDDGNLIATAGTTSRLPSTTSCPISTSFVSLAGTDFPAIYATFFR